MIAISEFVSHMLQNQFATGLGATAILGGLVYQLKAFPRKIWRFVLSRATIELVVNSKDPAYLWFDKWLSMQPYSKRAKNLLFKSGAGSNQIPGLDEDDLESMETKWILVPGTGSHLFVWRRTLVYLNRESKAPPNARISQSLNSETLNFRVIGFNQKIIRELIEDAKQVATNKSLVSIRMWSGGEYWKQVRGKTIRPLDTIILKHGQMARILEDLEWFEQAKDWYRHRGIPYRRGYLFSGPPGTGKTSLVLSLAGHLNRPVCVLNLSSITTDSSLFDAISDAPVNSIITIEDIDCANQSKIRSEESSEKGEKESFVGISKAGLLNAMDGISTPDGRIFIMTTNFPERLDPALIRPGRADVHEKFEYFGKEEQLLMAERFYGVNSLFEPLDTLVSPARMQAAFTMYPDDCKKASSMLAKEES